MAVMHGGRTARIRLAVGLAAAALICREAVARLRLVPAFGWG